MQHPDTNGLHVLVGFSKGQIQYINMQTKEQKVFNEGVRRTNAPVRFVHPSRRLELLGQSESDVYQMAAEPENVLHGVVFQRVFVRV